LPYEIRLNEEVGIIEILPSDVVTKQDIADSIANVNRIKREKGIYKILVDTRETTLVPGAADIFELFSNFPRDLKGALLITANQPTSQDIAFIETVAVNRGFNIRLFFSKDEALTWLKS
jgi:hypothetical protein